MFEYLMPQLVMPTYEGTLLDQTCRAVVAASGRVWRRARRALGHLGVGLQHDRRPPELPVPRVRRAGPGVEARSGRRPGRRAVCHGHGADGGARDGMRQPAADGRRTGFQGRYGFYEAIDYTASRLPRGQSSAVVRSFMAHHQGMSFLSLAYLLLDRPMQRRFESDPSFQATDLLLQERIPVAKAFYPHAVEKSVAQRAGGGDEGLLRVYKDSNTPTPEVQLLSNGRYTVMVTDAGGGYSHWKDLAVTRWREDATQDNFGSFCYLREVSTGVVWSASYQPTLRRAKSYEAIFSQSRAEFRRRDGDFDTHTEIAVSPEDDIELRRITVNNRSREPRTIEITSYAEVVLAPAAADAAHPAFSNLFVQTEILRTRQAILCTRRPRSDQETNAALVPPHGGARDGDRRDVLRNRSAEIPGTRSNGRRPRAHSRVPAELSDSEGSVLDPIVAIRQSITIDADESARIDLVTGVAATRDDVFVLIEKYRDQSLADRVFDLAWSHGQVILRQLNATEADAQLYGRLAELDPLRQPRAPGQRRAS